MKRAGPLWAISQGLDLGHVEFGRWLTDHHRVTDELPPDEPILWPPKLTTPEDPKPVPDARFWTHSRE
jgi:hypothetical protein